MADGQRPFVDIKSRSKVRLNTEINVDLRLQVSSDYEGGTRKHSEKVGPRGPTFVPAEPPLALSLGPNLLRLGIKTRSGNPVFCLPLFIELRNNVSSADDDAVRNERDPMPSKRRRLSASTHPEQQQALKPSANNNNGPSYSVPGTGCQKSKMRRARAADERTIVALRNMLLRRTGRQIKRKHYDKELMNTVRVHSDGVPRSHEGNLPNFDLLGIDCP